jgi:hypothetical protein
MAYLGRQPNTGVRSRFIFTATASQVTFSGTDDDGKTLKYEDSAYVDVFLNGVLLKPVTDYTATTKTSVVLTSGAAASDIVEIVAYDIANIADTVSKTNGGTFDAGVTVNGTVNADGLTIDTNTLYVDAANNRVGIGETDPLGSLHIKSEDTGVSSVSAQGDLLVLEGTETGLSILSSTSGAGYINFGDSSDNDIGMIIYDHSANTMNFWTNAAERARITSDGNLFIGGSTSYYSGGKLQVDGGKVIFRSSDASYGTFQLGVPSGTEASMAYIPNVTGFGSNPSSSSGDNAIFVTGPGAYGQSATEYVIGNKGRGGYIAKVAYNATSWTFNSDERLKDIEGEIKNALDKLGVIRAVYYRWKNDEAQERQVGVIAQEVQTVLPEAVDVPEIETNEDGTTNYWGVGYTDLIPLLIASVKELNAKVEACEAKNTEQQALIEDLQTRLAALENA